MPNTPTVSLSPDFPSFSNIQIAREFGVLLDELSTRLDLVAHQHLESRIRQHCIFHRNLENRSCLRIHRRIPELNRIHFAESLVALDVRTLSVAVAQASDIIISLLFIVRVVLVLSFCYAIEGGLRDVHVSGFDQLRHLPEKESEKKSANVRAVDGGIRHQDALV